MDDPRPTNTPPGGERPTDLSDDFWERTRRTASTRRSFFWLLMGVMAAYFFLRGGVVFTPQ